MSYDDILKFVTQNPVCTLATCAKNQPHNRAFLTNTINDKIYFTTSSHKNVGKEILENRTIELCYLASDFSKMLRIEAKVLIDTDIKLKQKMIDEKEYLKGFKANDETFILFTLEEAKAKFWMLSDNMNEDKLEIIIF
jgi:uncharacterized pyridoxamine 5'-phosphate oxidase family protein